MGLRHIAVLAAGYAQIGRLEYARDAIELAAAAFTHGTKVSLLTELRYREKVMGTTWSSRQDLRIRYIAPGNSPPASVTQLDTYSESLVRNALRSLGMSDCRSLAI